MINETDIHADAPPAGPQPGWVTLNSLRDTAFTGEVIFHSDPEIRVYIDNGVPYFAERATDETLGRRLLDAGLIDAAQLERGTVRVGDVQHLGRLFDRDPSVDRDAVMVVTEESTQRLLSELANDVIATSTTTAYRHHPSGVHRWFVAPSESTPVTLPVSEVAQVDKSIVDDLPGLPSAGDTDAGSDELRIVWDEPVIGADDADVDVADESEQILPLDEPMSGFDPTESVDADADADVDVTVPVAAPASDEPVVADEIVSDPVVDVAPDEQVASPFEPPAPVEPEPQAPVVTDDLPADPFSIAPDLAADPVVEPAGAHGDEPPLLDIEFADAESPTVADGDQPPLLDIEFVAEPDRPGANPVPTLEPAVDTVASGVEIEFGDTDDLASPDASDLDVQLPTLNDLGVDVSAVPVDVPEPSVTLEPPVESGDVADPAAVTPAVDVPVVEEPIVEEPASDVGFAYESVAPLAVPDDSTEPVAEPAREIEGVVAPRLGDVEPVVDFAAVEPDVAPDPYVDFAAVEPDVVPDPQVDFAGVAPHAETTPAPDFASVAPPVEPDPEPDFASVAPPVEPDPDPDFASVAPPVEPDPDPDFGSVASPAEPDPDPDFASVASPAAVDDLAWIDGELDDAGAPFHITWPDGTEQEAVAPDAEPEPEPGATGDAPRPVVAGEVLLGSAPAVAAPEPAPADPEAEAPGEPSDEPVDFEIPSVVLSEVPDPDSEVPDDVSNAVLRAIRAIESASAMPATELDVPVAGAPTTGEVAVAQVTEPAPVDDADADGADPSSSEPVEVHPVADADAASLDEVGEAEAVAVDGPDLEAQSTTTVVAEPAASPVDEVPADPAPMAFAPPTMETRAEVMYARAAAEAEREAALSADADDAPTDEVPRSGEPAAEPAAVPASTVGVNGSSDAASEAVPEPRVASVVFVDDEEEPEPDNRAGALRRLIGSLRRR